MKWGLLILLFAVVGSGCASFEEAYILDREYGQAQMQSWDKLIAYPDGRYADQVPEGIEGINAESAMGVYHQSFAKPPTPTEVIKLGIVSD